MNLTAVSYGMSAGEEIYGKSIGIIDSLLKNNKYFNDSYSEAEKHVVKRVIHATSDISYAETIFFTGGSAEKGIELIKEKIVKKEPLKIVCDSEMTKAGISRNINKNIILDLNCYINYIEMLPDAGTTKSAFSIKAAIGAILPDIIIIGNAPTALTGAMELCNGLYETINYKPSLIIGMPVGFVGAAESKAALYENNFYDAIGNFGNLGGSSSASSAMNALLRESL
jgi:precorrin-8X/cobalt-precorrin-8 methylmutase